MSDNQIELETPRETIYHNNIQYIDLNKNKIIKECISEFFGMYFFILLSLGNIAVFVLFPESKLTWDGVSISWGLNLMLGVYLASFNSKAHLNPCVSLCMYLFNKDFNLKQVLYYTLSQLFAAFLASATVFCIYFNKIKMLENDKTKASIFTTFKSDDITTVSAFFTEFIGTALLVGGIFSIIKHKETNKNVPIYVGLLLSSIILSFGFQTAFALNPARDLGPRIFTAMVGYNSFSYSDYYFWVPLVADYFGAIFGVGIYKIFIEKQLEE